MRTIQILLAVMIVMLLTNLAKASEADSTKIHKKIIKTIVVNDDGKTVTDSTFVYDGDDVKVYVNTECENLPEHRIIKHRMAVPHGKAMMWTDKGEMTYDVTVNSDGDSSNVVIMKGPDHIKKEFHFRNDDFMDPEQLMMIHSDDMPTPFKHIREMKHIKSNMIDLNDPDIISFEKETLKNGNEKITIISKGEKEE